MDTHSVLKTQRFDRPGRILIFGNGATAQFLQEELKHLCHLSEISREPDCSRVDSPDLIIVCLDALGEKAFKLTRAIKSDPATNEIPVLLISDSDDSLQQMCAFECGANDILVCPRNRNILGARIKVLIKYRNAVRELRQSHLHLEDRVRERTSELERTNQELRREIDERRRAEEALKKSEEAVRQLQKVEALGKLAGGVAHDFNNILFVIMGYAETLKNGLEAGHRLQRAVDQIQRASDRAAALTRQLLAFGRRRGLQPRVINLGKQLRETTSMLERLVGPHIQLHLATGTNLGNVKLDIAQFEQIVMNLAVNARDAMPSGGQLHFELENAPAFAPSQLPRDIAPGDFIVMSVTDNGCGMTEATRQRIFEPFFTTKEPGKGTGLGLATVFSIVAQNGGWIDVHSEVGKGTRFEIYLPRTNEALSSPQLPAVVDATQADGQTVLIVEDDPIVRELLRAILRRAGYGVLEAGDGREALEMVHAGARPQVLLTDVLMPEINGADLVRKLQPECPNMRVIFMSAHSDELLSSFEDFQFIQKPFIARAVVRKIRETLASAS